MNERGSEYKIEFVSSAAKEFRNLPLAVRQHLEPIINKLSLNPRPFGVKKLEAKFEFYRVRSGNYRIIFKINDTDRKVLITRIGHRKDIYK
ncbi:MAG: type II toxin-antitoxin system RelE/ParE family toxin [Melioribacteraceae bacterium]